MSHRILVMNGPNLNLLGTRQPEVYGPTTLSDIEALCHVHAESIGVAVDFMQSNSEGTLIDTLQAARGVYGGVVLNAGAYTHTSIALMDAVTSIALPVIELHLSNVHAREDFRHESYLAKVALGIICGFGSDGYPLAISAMAQHLGGQT